MSRLFELSECSSLRSFHCNYLDRAHYTANESCSKLLYIDNDKLKLLSIHFNLEKDQKIISHVVYESSFINITSTKCLRFFNWITYQSVQVVSDKSIELWEQIRENSYQSFNKRSLIPFDSKVFGFIYSATWNSTIALEYCYVITTKSSYVVYVNEDLELLKVIEVDYVSVQREYRQFIRYNGIKAFLAIPSSSDNSNHLKMLQVSTMFSDNSHAVNDKLTIDTNQNQLSSIDISNQNELNACLISDCGNYVFITQTIRNDQSLQPANTISNNMVLNAISIPRSTQTPGFKHALPGMPIKDALLVAKKGSEVMNDNDGSREDFTSDIPSITLKARATSNISVVDSLMNLNLNVGSPTSCGPDSLKTGLQSYPSSDRILENKRNSSKLLIYKYNQDRSGNISDMLNVGSFDLSGYTPDLLAVHLFRNSFESPSEYVDDDLSMLIAVSSSQSGVVNLLAVTSSSTSLIHDTLKFTAMEPVNLPDNTQCKGITFSGNGSQLLVYATRKSSNKSVVSISSYATYSTYLFTRNIQAEAKNLLMSKTDLQSNVDSIINTAKMESITNNNIESNLLSLISQILPAIQDLKSNITDRLDGIERTLLSQSQSMDLLAAQVEQLRQMSNLK